jgi:signal transduction histidine kinase
VPVPYRIILPLYGLATLVPLYWRRQRPLVVFWTVWALALAARLLFDDFHPTVALLVALVAVAQGAGEVAALPAFVGSLLCSAFAVRQAGELGGGRAMLVAGFGYLVLHSSAWLLGRWRRHADHRVREVERERAEAERRATESERARIARELHDIVSHSVTVMTMQAAGASRLVHTDAHRAERALTEIARCGAYAVEELHRMLAVLAPVDGREDDAAFTGRTLEALLAPVRQTGLDVELRHEGRPREVDPRVGLTARRVLQECLTNTLKHAGQAARTSVAVVWHPESLELVVTNDIPPRVGSGAGSGTGLAGVRSRVEDVGGTFRIRRGRAHHTVAVVLPIHPGGVGDMARP